MSESRSAEPAIRVSGLSKRFGAVEALRGVSLEAAPGEALGLAGENGSGKTTLLRILATLLRPDSGRVEAAGHDLLAEPRAVRKVVGYVPQRPTADEDLTAAENLRFFCGLYGMTRAHSRQRVPELLELAGLEAWADRQVRQLSGGMRRRLEIVRALAHEPPILLLDEPTAGLDSESRAALWQTLEALRRRSHTTIVFATHQIAEDGPRLDRMLELRRGARSVEPRS